MQTLNSNGVKVSLTMVVEATWKMHYLRNFVLSFVKLTNTLQYLELTKSEKDFTALKAQSEGLSKEYDRLLEEYTQTKVRIRSVAGGIYPNKGKNPTSCWRNIPKQSFPKSSSFCHWRAFYGWIIWH